MIEKYKILLIDAERHFTEIATDKANIERGIKEKPCFKPIIDSIHLALLCGILRGYMEQLEKVIKILEETKGQNTRVLT